MRQLLIESAILRKINFPLFSELKKWLGNWYLITIQDINRLARLSSCWSVKGNRQTMQNILNFMSGLDEEEKEIMYEIHCDPYELFIDAGRIDTKLNILI